MRIGIYYSSVVTRDSSGWASRNRGLVRYLWELDRRGIDVLLWAPEVALEPVGHRLPPSVHVVPLAGFQRWIGGTLRSGSLVAAFRRTLPRVDYVWIRHPAPLGWWLARRAHRLGKPVLWDVVGDPATLVRVTGHYSRFLRPLALAAIGIESYLVRRSMRATASRFVNQELEARFGAVGPRSLVRPSGVLVEADFFSRPTYRAAPPFRLLALSFLRPEKGIEHFLDAVAAWQGEEIVVDIVGDGPSRDLLVRKARALGVGRAVTFHGFIDDEEVLRNFYREADVFVLPSLSEGTPRTLFEAMAARLPIVASSVGGIPHVVHDGVNGVLVPPGDSSALSAGIQQLIDRPDLRERLANAGAKSARQHTVEGFIDDLVALMDGMRRAEGRP